MTDEELRMWADTVSELLDMAVPPQYMGGVMENLSVLYEHASKVMQFPLPGNLEAITAFKP